jgi:ATP-dependent protease Clp ATPase subunit
VARPRRGTGPVPVLGCSLCEVHQNHLVAGPGVYICATCIAAAARAIETRRPVATPSVTIEPVPVDSADRQCGFCAKTRPQVTAMASAGDGGACVCDECLDLCRELLLAGEV